MKNVHIQWLVNFSVYAACLVACDGNTSLDPSTLSRVESLATLNAGTHPLLDLIGRSPVRETCDIWYGNDLCTTDAESLAADAIKAEMPDILLLQEIWDQTLCDDPQRPAYSAESPFACSAGDTHQLIRVLPEDYAFACGTDKPGSRDALSCIAFKRSVFTPQGSQGVDKECGNRDCSSLLEILETECDSQWGKIVMLRGRTNTGPAVLVSVHLFLDIAWSALMCQAEQIRVLNDALDGLPDDTLVIVGGDFNLDLRLPLPGAVSLAEMQAEQEMELLGETERTNQLIPLRLDMIFTRDWERSIDPGCRVTFLNPEEGPPMIDHGLVMCR